MPTYAYLDGPTKQWKVAQSNERLVLYNSGLPGCCWVLECLNGDNTDAGADVMECREVIAVVNLDDAGRAR